MEEAHSCLTSLPSELLLNIGQQLDGSSLARFTECTSQGLTTTFHLHIPDVAAMWDDLASELGTCLTAFPHDGSIRAQCSSKNRFVRMSCFMQTRCARCGRRSLPSRRVDGTIDTNRYLHLCDWLTAIERPAQCADADETPVLLS
jgi:hypothetical protein